MLDEMIEMDFGLWAYQRCGGKIMWQHKYNWSGVHKQTSWWNKTFTHKSHILKREDH